MMVGDEPADTLCLLDSVVSGGFEELSGFRRSFLFLMLSVAYAVFLFADVYADVVYDGGRFQYEQSFFVQLFQRADNRSQLVYFDEMLDAFGVACVVGGHEGCQSGVFGIHILGLLMCCHFRRNSRLSRKRQ
ncbi:unknown [Bacteroides sp. CAG:661]|nr:unknown [Bacteroides sp. CAG:661]